MAPQPSEESRKDERTTHSMLIVATVWAAIIVYFALHSALN